MKNPDLSVTILTAEMLDCDNGEISTLSTRK